MWYGKSYYRQLIGNHTPAFDWCHFWWPWSTFEGHFSLGCHFHVHFSNPWHAFASHGLPAIAEPLVFTRQCVARPWIWFGWLSLSINRVCLSVSGFSYMAALLKFFTVVWNSKSKIEFVGSKSDLFPPIFTPVMHFLMTRSEHHSNAACGVWTTDCSVW